MSGHDKQPFLRQIPLWGNRRGNVFVDATILLLIFIVIGMNFSPRLLFTPTITTGGDTPSHYFTLRYLIQVFLPHGRLSGWSPSAYAGFPMLEFYFPLPFLCMAVMSTIVSLPVAFKLGTVMGVMLLPFCAYGCLRLLQVPFPGPALAAIGTLPFLFSESHSMWGGNIPSLLAGEFAYSLSFAFLVFWMGTLYSGVKSGRHAFLNAVLLALIGFSHGYPLLFAGVLSLFFIIGRKTFLTHMAYLVRMHIQAILLLSVWLLPLLKNLPWTTAYDFIWYLGSWKEVLPPILIPQALLAGYAVGIEIWKVIRKKMADPATLYLMAAGGAGGMLYAVAPVLGVVDIRFLPFVQMILIVLAPIGLMRLSQSVRGKILIPFMALALTLWWVGTQVKFIPQWIEWNYSGYETKRLWPVYARINDLLKGSMQDPRVVYEHSMQHEALGTVRAWESLPLFSGRSTLEHAYFQASPSAPFVFYLQSEISQQISCPFPDYGCTSIDLDRAQRHLELFNVREMIVISAEVKARLRKNSAYQLKATIPPYEIYETQGPHRYVTLLQYEPGLWMAGQWKQTAYTWFRNAQINDVHLVFPLQERSTDTKRFLWSTSNLAEIPKQPSTNDGSIHWEKITENEIVFETSALHKPHLIKFSYHPNWRVEGADHIYLVSPAFMLVYPHESHVRIFYARSIWEYVGFILTLIGLSFPLWLRLGRAVFQRAGLVFQKISNGAQFSLWVAVISVLIGVILFLGGLASSKRIYAPYILFDQAVRYKDQKQWKKSEDLLKIILLRSPQSAQAEHARYYLGIIHYLQGNWEEAIREFNFFVMSFSDSRWLAEVYYHLGLCYEHLGRTQELQRVQDTLFQRFADTQWAQYARDRWDKH